MRQVTNNAILSIRSERTNPPPRHIRSVRPLLFSEYAPLPYTIVTIREVWNVSQRA